MDEIASKHGGHTCAAQPGPYDRVSDVQSAGISPKRRQDQPLAVGDETPSAEAAADANDLGAGVQVPGHFAQRRPRGRLVDQGQARQRYRGQAIAWQAARASRIMIAQDPDQVPASGEGIEPVGV
jgi:hypothetical protein